MGSYKMHLDNKIVIRPNDKLVVCPYDKWHLVLPCRLGVHIERCARNHPNVKLSCCPFNSTHWVKPQDLKTHVENCTSANEIVNMENVLPSSEPRASTVPLYEQSENWDDEPPAPTYDPTEFCRNNPIIRKATTGLSKSQRVAFRESERERHRKFNNQK